MTIVGSDPVGKDNSQGDGGPQGFANEPGPHRYIGIGIVSGLAFLILILWLAFGRWPRRKMREWGWLKATPISEEEEESGATEKPRVVDEIIPPKEPGKVKTRSSGEHRGRRQAVASWEAEIDYKVSWEMKQKQNTCYEPDRVIVTPDRTDYMPSDRRARRSRS
ncbi:hypothetical protein C0992_012557 [Termitomyces sp. T32_za158]|nr:hypothetical protein C0992_012557 [Termitomyces sp. T32_za158]